MDDSGPTISVDEWWCGDEECDCSRPEVNLRGDPTTKQKCVMLAKGPFVCHGYGGADKEDVDAQEKWAEEAREWYFLAKRRNVGGRKG